MALLAMEEVSVRYGAGAVAVDGVDLQIESGSVTAIVGPNGAGKSSLLLALYGSVPIGGHIWLDGTDISTLRARDRARLGISLVPQGRQLFPSLTVQDNLAVMGPLLRTKSVDFTKAYDLFPILGQRRGQMAGNLSGGEQQMLVLARALLQDPRVLLLDEVSAGLAPRLVQGMLDTALKLAQDGAAVLIAEPSIGALEGRIDRGVVLIRGRVMAQALTWRDLNARYQECLGMTSAPDVMTTSS
jgi:branched-chain amino acid transport system ATP-binding protein